MPSFALAVGLRLRSARSTFLCAGLILLALNCLAQDVAQPQVGQLGKDVVWVPTPERLVIRMLQMADTTSADTVVDLGSGDGRIPIAAAKHFGARALGVEYDDNLVRLSIHNAEREGVAGRVRFAREDLFKTDLSQASVITLYLSPTIMTELRPRLLALEAGTRIVAHQFTLGDWEPDETATVENVPAYLWVVPARVAGKWRLSLDGAEYDLELRQEHQMLRGEASFGDKRSPVIAARLRGDAVRFTFVDRNGDARSFSGSVEDDAMHGTSRAYARPETAWRARR